MLSSGEYGKCSYCFRISYFFCIQEQESISAMSEGSSVEAVVVVVEEEEEGAPKREGRKSINCSSVWDFDMVQKKKDGSWRCSYCDLTYKGQNASKAIAHLAGI